MMKQKANSTLRASRAVPHPSTDRAFHRLTSEFRWDRVYSMKYGRWRRQTKLHHSHVDIRKVPERYNKTLGEPNIYYVTSTRGTNVHTNKKPTAP